MDFPYEFLQMTLFYRINQQNNLEVSQVLTLGDIM